MGKRGGIATTSRLLPFGSLTHLRLFDKRHGIGNGGAREGQGAPAPSAGAAADLCAMPRRDPSEDLDYQIASIEIVFDHPLPACPSVLSPNDCC